MNTKEDLKLLTERLTKRYGKDKALKLMMDNKENLFGYHGLAWSLGKRDLYFFNMYYLKNVYTGEGKAKLANVHLKLWEDIQNMYTKNTTRRLAKLLPRGTGKSLTGSLSVAIWTALYGYSKYTVVASAVNDTALTFINNIRSALIDNKRIEASFGEIYDPNLTNTTDKIELKNNVLIQALSSRSSFRGKSYKGTRIELLILDDYQSEDNVSTKQQKDKHWKKFSDDSAHAVEKETYRMVAMGTIIDEGDFYHRLSKLPTWNTTIEKAVLLDDIDSHFNSGLWGEFKELLFDPDDQDRLQNAKDFYYENYEDMQYPLLWQDYWDCLDIALTYYENPVSFKQEMQLELADNTKTKFTNIIYTEELPEPTVLAIDPATSSKADSDYTAFVLGEMKDDIIYIDHAEIQRLEFEDYIAKTAQILMKYESINTIIIEKQTYNGADVLALKNYIQRDVDLYYRDFKWINEHQSKNKDAKIDSIVGDVNLGRVQFNKGLKGSEALKQLKEFKTTKTSPHDDLPDVLSELILYFKEDNLEMKQARFFSRSLLF